MFGVTALKMFTISFLIQSFVLKVQPLLLNFAHCPPLSVTKVESGLILPFLSTSRVVSAIERSLKD